MKYNAASILLIFFLLLITPFCIHAQEESSTVVTQGNRYISLKIKSIDKYNSRVEHQQDHLLKKLKRKEKHFAHQLKNSDSLAYAKYKQQTSPSYDSISKVSKSDTGATDEKFSKKKNATVDSLRGVQSFVESKSGLPTNAPQTQGTTADFNRVQGKLNFGNYITQLITQRTNNLQSLTGSSNVPGLKGIEKQVFYGKAKMKVFKEMEDEPTVAEDKAMEYLQGSSGFDKYMKNAANGGTESMQSIVASGGSAEQLANMGYQTKKQMQSNLQQKFAGNLGGVTSQLSGEISQWQDKKKGLNKMKASKQSLEQIKSTDKPNFKINPMRCVPVFWKRIQRQYNWQATRASGDGKQPAMVQPSAMFGFKHTPKLIYGIGVATAIGLGQSWQYLHITYRGVGFRTFATWQWQYGIGAYAGYERMYNQFAFTKKEQPQSADVPVNAHNTAKYNESILIGLTKSYHLNSKYEGQIQLLYDIWWKEKGLITPIVLRFATIKK